MNPEPEAELYKFLESFQTPEGTRDLKRLLSSVDIPVYVLVNESLTFRLLGVNVSAKVAKITQVCPVFVSPDYADYTQTVMICQLNQEAFSPGLREGLLEYHLLRPLAWHLVCGYLPSRFGPPFDPEDVNSHWSAQSLSQVAWEPHAASGFQFGVFYWDEPVPLSLAHSRQKSALIGIGAVGVSRSEFLTILASLVRLRADDNLIGKFQKELSSAAEEMQQKYGRR